MRGATRCMMHGGRNQLAPRGSRQVGGRPVESGVYARYLKSELLEDYEAFDVGNIDQEIRLLKALLADTVRRHADDPTGGYVVSAGPIAKVRLHSDVVSDLANMVSRLETRRAQLLAGPAPTDPGDALEDYRTWLRSAGRAAPAEISAEPPATAAPAKPTEH